jgi:hypothetical protein
MTPEEIIRAYAKRNNLSEDVQLKIARQFVADGAHFVTCGKSALLIAPILNVHNTFMSHFYSAASPVQVLRESKKILQSVKKDGKPKMFFWNSENLNFIQLLKQAGIKVQKSVVPQFTWMAGV